MPTWLRCRDRETGHEFDLAPEDIRIEQDTVEVLKDYPENSGLTAQPRPAKYRVNLEPVTPPESPPEPVADQPEGSPPDDNPPAVTSANKRRSPSNG